MSEALTKPIPPLRRGRQAWSRARRPTSDKTSLQGTACPYVCRDRFHVSWHESTLVQSRSPGPRSVLRPCRMAESWIFAASEIQIHICGLRAGVRCGALRSIAYFQKCFRKFSDQFSPDQLISGADARVNPIQALAHYCACSAPPWPGLER
jgi:hypothetical protein